MAFLDKIAKQERTGAGIAGVNVDTGIANMISPKNFDGTPIRAIGTMSTYQLEVLDTIEKFAKDVDKARTENAKIKLGLDLENARIDLEEKWASVHDKYTNDDTWNSYLEDKKKLLSEQSKMISSMKYMSMEEKKLAIEKNSIAYREDYAKNLGKRTDAVAKREADNAIGNLEQMVAITSNLDIHDDKKAQENYKTMVNQINILKEFAGLSNEQALVMYGNYVTKAEMGRQENYLEQVVMNEDLTFEQREAKLNELKKVMDNKDLMRAYAKEMADLFTTDNKEEAEEYLYTKLTDESSKVINRMSNQFKRVKKERQEAERARAKEEKAMQKFLKQQAEITAIKNEKKYEDDLFKRDAVAVASYLDNKKGDRNLSLNEFLSNPVHMQRVTDTGWETYGDTNSGETLNIIPESLVKDLKSSIDDKINSGQFTRREAYQEVYDVADTLSNGNEAIRNNILKDMGLKLKVDPSIIINGEKNSKYYNLSNSIAQANNFIDEMGYSLSDLKKTKENKKFKEISQTFSSDKELGDQLAFRYLVGEELKKTNKKDLAQDLDRTLSIGLRKNGYNKENVQTTSEFTSKRKNYRYSKLKDVREKKNQKEKVENKKVERKIKSDVLNQATVLGG